MGIAPKCWGFGHPAEIRTHVVYVEYERCYSQQIEFNFLFTNPSHCPSLILRYLRGFFSHWNILTPSATLITRKWAHWGEAESPGDFAVAFDAPWRKHIISMATKYVIGCEFVVVVSGPQPGHNHTGSARNKKLTTWIDATASILNVRLKFKSGSPQ